MVSRSAFGHGPVAGSAARTARGDAAAAHPRAGGRQRRCAPAPAPGPVNNVTINNNRATEDGTGRILTTHLDSMYRGALR